jgi:hypothetical protein
MTINKVLVCGIEDGLFRESVKNGRSWVEVCKNLKIHEENRKHVLNRAKQMGLDFSHFVHAPLNMDFIKKTVSESGSYFEVEIKTGKSAKYVRKLIRRYKISTDHFKRIKSKNIRKNTGNDELINTLASAKTLSEALKNLNLIDSKDNFEWLEKRIRDIGLDPERFKKIDWAGSHEKIWELISKRKYNRVMAKYILFYGLKKNECEHCGQGPVHNKKPLVLQCHHKDGNRKNNSKNNIEILCPNCHTQTNNYARSLKTSNG